jgi:hypothetical protein
MTQPSASQVETRRVEVGRLGGQHQHAVPESPQNALRKAKSFAQAFAWNWRWGQAASRRTATGGQIRGFGLDRRVAATP